MAAYEAGDLTAAGGVADHDGVFEVELFEERREVVGVGVHLVAARGLVGAPVAAPIVGDRSVAIVRQEDHLRLPGVGVEGPAVAEDDGLPFAPVLEVDPGAVFRRDRARRFSSAVFRGECGHAFASF